MLKVSVLGVPEKNGVLSYVAVQGDKQAVGETIGKALDALTEQLPMRESTVVVVQKLQPDIFFEADDQHRLIELMKRWRETQRTDELFPVAEQEELEKLVEKELRASEHRGAGLTQALESDR